MCEEENYHIENLFMMVIGDYYEIYELLRIKQKRETAGFVHIFKYLMLI